MDYIIDRITNLIMNEIIISDENDPEPKFKDEYGGMYYSNVDQCIHLNIMKEANSSIYDDIIGEYSKYVKYHECDVSYNQLLTVRNSLRQIYKDISIISASVVDANSSIEIELEDEKSKKRIIDYLISTEITENFIDNHIKFFIYSSKNYEEEVSSISEMSVTNSVAANPGKTIQGEKIEAPGTCVKATNGFSAVRNGVYGIVTAWHYTVHTSRHFWVEARTANQFANTNYSDNSTHDSAFIPFDPSCPCSSTVSKTIEGTTKHFTHVATSSTISGLSGKSLKFYGCITPGQIGIVSALTADYNMSYIDSTGTTRTTMVLDCIRTTNASVNHGDSGGPVIYEGSTNVTLVGIISGKSSSYQYINKITNIRSDLSVNVTG